MPLRRKPPTKRPRRRRAPGPVARTRRLFRPARGLSQRIVPFKRTVSQIVDTDQIANLPANYSMSNFAVTGYSAVLGTQVFTLNQLPEYANLQNLYKFYKINCVVIKLYPCYNNTVPNGATSISNSASYQGQNIMVTYVQNQTGTGISTSIDNNYWMTQTGRKQRMLTGNRPITIKVYPKIQNEIYSSLTNTDYSLMKPRFISTTEDSTPHYGLDMAFNFTDYNDRIRENFSSTYTTPVKFRMDMTYYLQLKGTH